MENYTNPAHEEPKDNMSGSPMTIQEQVDNNPKLKELGMKLLSDKDMTFEQELQGVIDRSGIDAAKQMFQPLKYIYQNNLKELGKQSISEDGFNDIYNRLLITPREKVSKSISSSVSDLFTKKQKVAICLIFSHLMESDGIANIIELTVAEKIGQEELNLNLEVDEEIKSLANHMRPLYLNSLLGYLQVRFTVRKLEYILKKFGVYGLPIF